MEKTFKVPKEFTEKWLVALRSGKYEQVVGLLNKRETNKYCCLGIACIVAGVPLIDIEGCNTPRNLTIDMPEEFPSILMDVPDQDYDFVHLMMILNDGMYLSSYDQYRGKYPNLVKFRNPAQENSNNLLDVVYNFKEIADFIEANCEFV